MLNTRLSGQQCSQSKLDPNQPFPPRCLRNAYVTRSSDSLYFLPDMNEQDNQPFIRKYYPKRLVSCATALKRLPKHLASCTKGAKSLTIYPWIIQGSPCSVKNLKLFNYHNGPKVSPLKFKKTMLAYKNVHTLELWRFSDEQSLNHIMYMRNLEALHLNLKEDQLQDLNKGIVHLEALESLNVLIQKKNGSFDPDLDPEPFLDFCKMTLAKKTLKAFKLRFDRTIGHYSSDTFEKLFTYIEKSTLERWDIQTTLLDDQALRIAETYAIFKQVQRLAVYSSNGCFSSQYDGFTIDYNSFDQTVQVQERPDKSITIYVMKSDQEISHQFELESMLRECPELKCLFIELFSDLLTEPLPFSEDFKGHQSLKTIYFRFPGSIEKYNWLHLFQTLENTPFLEKFYVHMPDAPIKSRDGTLDEAFNSVQELTKRLARMKHLKSLEFNIFAGPQTGLDALHELLENIQGLEELSLYLYYDKYDPISYDITSVGEMPKLSFGNMTGLTQLRFGVRESASMHLSSMIDALSQMNHLRVLEFRNATDVQLPLNLWFSLMKESGKLAGLERFVFYPMTDFYSPNKSAKTDVETTEILIDMIKQEIKRMAIDNQKLSYAKLEFCHRNDRVFMEYIK